ncbi:MAG: hypothetical protein ACKO8I_18845, partial [Cyanobacteriota bacterium]
MFEFGGEVGGPGLLANPLDRNNLVIVMSKLHLIPLTINLTISKLDIERESRSLGGEIRYK